jgi:hypothetical protein
MSYKSIIKRVSEEHLKMTLQGSKHVLILNQPTNIFVALTAEYVKGLNIFYL